MYHCRSYKYINCIMIVEITNTHNPNLVASFNSSPELGNLVKTLRALGP